MKFSLSLLAMAALCVATSILQTGCAGVYAVGPAPVVYGPGYPVSTWGNTGFYNGAVYRSGWNNNYYRGNSASWNNRSGSVNGWRGGSASWNNGSGSADGYRGGSADWSHGSGSATGWRGGSASWGGGSGSWHGSGGRHR